MALFIRILEILIGIFLLIFGMMEAMIRVVGALYQVFLLSFGVMRTLLLRVSFFLPGLLFFLCLAVYFLPAVIAHARKRNDTARMLILNAVLGWTIMGWIVLLVWSLRRRK